MADYAHDMTDQELAALEKRIAQVYKDAASEMSDTVNDYFDSFSDRIEGQKALLDSGEITQEQYNQWMINQIGRGENYQSLRNALADRYTDANEVAISYVNDATPGIYSLNRNYSNYSLEQLGNDISFNLWDESTVRRMLVQNPSLMPNYPEAKAVKRGIDLNYGKQQISASVLSGILQGKSISQIARNLMNRLTDMNFASAVRAARTAFTAAENGGRQDSYEEAAEMGLEVQKVWLATLDKKTRPAHQRADYQVVNYDDFFIVDGEKLMFPGDAEHGASGANLYNCRCTMFRKKPGESLDDIKRWARDPETGLPEDVQGMSYEDWIKSKEPDTILSEADTMEKAKDYAKSGDYDKCDSLQSIRSVTDSKLGYDGLPKVVSESEFNADSSPTYYRGVHDSEDKTASQIVDEYKYGDLWTGNSGGSAYGTGTYFATDENVASSAQYKGDDGSIIEAKLSSDAKVADYITVHKEWFNEWKQLDETEDYYDLIAEVGQYAAIKGYDAIATNGALGNDYLVVLNRSKLIIKE